ncbi:MAG TPA: TIGR03435 family protein [Bryobacteraceae bacterium]|nr:TIGR03435 family protein [Bryobacteraceae bacterium]
MRWSVCLAAVCALWGQDRPAFEAASIRASSPGGDQTWFEINSSGRLIVRAMDVWDMIARAFGTRDSLMMGGPAWIKSDGFNIQATPPGNGTVDRFRALRMLQTLLEDRFHLRWHQEMRDTVVYALRVAPGGPKLATAREGHGAGLQPGSLSAPGMTLGTLCNILEHETRRLVIDRTGLNGSYAIELQWARDAAGGAADTSRPSIFTAMRDQLGLRLEPEKTPLKVMAIDDVRRPSAN